ncbi:hypothetical protein [Pinirhizobacter soli]|uniref:hypothetical protein n=1 Tax=Pinirhizobacter soli TaxID=2786953 RepID=UPI00202A0BEE|nr:hypothetical protein [Pinirhizobacter soli]
MVIDIADARTARTPEATDSRRSNIHPNIRITPKFEAAIPSHAERREYCRYRGF